MIRCNSRQALMTAIWIIICCPVVRAGSASVTQPADKSSPQYKTDIDLKVEISSPDVFIVEPSTPGKFVAICHSNDRMNLVYRVLDLTTGKFSAPIETTMRVSGPDIIQHSIISADAGYLAGGFMEVETVRLSDAKRMPSFFAHRVLDFLPDGLALVAGAHRAQEIGVLELSTGKVKREFTTLPGADTELGTVSPDKKFLAETVAGGVGILTLPTGKHLKTLQLARSERTGQLAWSSDGQHIAMLHHIGDEGKLTIWDWKTGRTTIEKAVHFSSAALHNRDDERNFRFFQDCGLILFGGYVLDGDRGEILQEFSLIKRGEGIVAITPCGPEHVLVVETYGLLKREPDSPISARIRTIPLKPRALPATRESNPKA